MRPFLYSFLIIWIAVLTAKAQTDTLKTQQLNGVTVNGQYIQQTVDHYNCIHTAKQKKHSHSGFELVSNMMIAGVSVDADNGIVTTPAGAATLYINGREVSYREIQSLRPKDITRVEYYDMPTGKYAKDKAVLNYVVKTYKSGGYTQLDALQGVGYQRGDYNITSKYSFKSYNANFWAGYNIDMDNSTLLRPAITYSVNYKQFSAMLSSYYMYMSNAIVNTYNIQGDNVINSFSSDARSHQVSNSLSVTWKPSDNFNMKWDGNFTYYRVTKAANEQLRCWQTGLQANYYVGDFSFSANCNSSKRQLVDYQYHIKKP